MNDTLRTRIIKAIGAEVYSDGGNSDLSLATRAADAVMAVVSDEYVNSRGMFHEPDRCLGCEECCE